MKLVSTARAVNAAIIVIVLTPALPADDGESSKLVDALIFHSGFDGTTDANLADDGWIYTAESTARQKVRVQNHRQDVTIARDAGRYGDALRFSGNSKQVLFYKGENMQYREHDWSGTVSFWLKLDPDNDLEPGYCDPIQITERKWNDAAMFIDFDKDLPRDMRLGMFPDFDQWNPKNTPFEKIAVDKRPMVTVRKPPFSRTEWTHVVFTFENINATDNSPATSTLYLNGELQGKIERPTHFRWEPKKTAIMIGIHYIGDFDDLAIFNRALTQDEIARLRKLPHGASDIR